MATMNTAPIKWAQRSDSLYVTIALPDVTDEAIELKDELLNFKGKSGGKDYEVHITFFKPVNAADSTYKVHPRNVQMHIMKATKIEKGGGGGDDDAKQEEGEDHHNEDEPSFWPRLVKDKALEKNQIAVDWDRYVDEDEEDEAGGFDMSGLQGGSGFGGGMGGMGGMDGMGGMGGMGGPGGPGGMDMDALMKQMGGMGGKGGGEPGDGDSDDEDDDDDDDDNDELPDLEDA